MLVRRVRFLVTRVPKTRFSQKVEESTGKASSEQKLEEEVYTEEEVHQPRNIYWVWTKRAIGVALGYTALTTLYTAVKRAYYPQLYWTIFEVDPFRRYAHKTCSAANDAYEFLFSPPLKALLPMKPPLRTETNKKTLVLNFEGVLYSKDFQARDGLVIHLRPGFYKFIQQVLPHYEVLLYSEEDTNFMSEVIQTIDPTMRYFPWFAGQEFMVRTPEGYRKDLKLVNRDLKKIIVVDFQPERYINTLDNVLAIGKYNGEEEDHALRDLGALLSHLASLPLKEARKEVQKYGGKEAVKNFAKGMQEKINEQNARKDRFKMKKTLFH